MKEYRYLPYREHLVELARINRKNPTRAEYKMWSDILRRRQLAGFKFLRQKPIDGFIVDFYCSSLALVIEIDGDSHAEKAQYDAERTRILHSYQLHVIRYTNDDVLSNPQGVYDNLTQKIQKQLTSLALSSSPDKGRLGGVFIRSTEAAE